VRVTAVTGIRRGPRDDQLGLFWG